MVMVFWIIKFNISMVFFLYFYYFMNKKEKIWWNGINWILKNLLNLFLWNINVVCKVKKIKSKDVIDLG